MSSYIFRDLKNHLPNASGGPGHQCRVHNLSNHPFCRCSPAHNHGEEPCGTESSDDFKVILDVHHFTPEEITVSSVDQCLLVGAFHDEIEDDLGSISRGFKRRYVVPDGFDMKNIIPTLSSDGILTVRILKTKIDPEYKVIPIIRTDVLKNVVVCTDQNNIDKVNQFKNT